MAKSRCNIKTKEENDKTNREPSQPTLLGSYEFIGAYDAVERLHHFNGEAFSIEELQKAESFFRPFPGFERVSPAAKAYAIKHGGFADSSPSSAPASSKEPMPKEKQKQSLKSKASGKVGRLVIVCRQQGIPIPGRNPYETVNGAWAKFNGYSNESTNSQLEAKIKWLEGLIERALEGDRSIIRELS